MLSWLMLVAGSALLWLGVCRSGGDEPLDFTFIEVDAQGQATVVLYLAAEQQRVEIEGLQLLGGLSCSKEGRVVIDAAADGRLLPPLSLEKGEFVPIEGLPVGSAPALVEEDRLAFEVAESPDGLRIRVYNFDGRAVTPFLPGDDPFWLSAAEKLAVLGVSGEYFEQLGLYVFDLDAASSLPGERAAGPEVDEYGELLAFLPFPASEIDPGAERFGYSTRSAENQQGDIQVLDVDGRSNARTLTATPEHETFTRWTVDGSIIFVRQRLLDQDDDPDLPQPADVVVIDPSSGREETLASGAGIVALAACY